MLDYAIEVDGEVPEVWQPVPFDPNDVADLRQWLIEHLASDQLIDEWAAVAVFGDVTLTFLWDSNDLWVGESGKADEANVDPQFLGEGEAPPPEDDVTILPPVEAVGRRLMSDEMIQLIIDEYNSNNTPTPPSGGSGGTATPPAHLPPDLTEESCETLAFLAHERENKIASARNYAVHVLSATTDFFRGEEVYLELYDAFERLDRAGLLDNDNPVSSAARVFQEMRNPHSLLALTLRGIGIGIAIEYSVLIAIQSAYLAQKELDLVRAEQARRGGGCGD